MRALLAALAVLFALVVPGTATAAPPANDDFANAVVIDQSALPFSATVNNVEATTEPGEPLLCTSPPPEKTIWYSLTPSSDAVLRIDTGGSAFSTFLEVFQSSGPGFAGLTGISCQFFGSPVVFSAEAGTTYYVQAAAFPFSGGGDLRVNVQEIPPPPNDDFADAAVIPSLPYTNVVDNTGAASEASEPAPSCVGSVPTGSVWYAYTPSASGSVSARVSGPFSTAVAAYTGSGIDGLSQVGCRSFGSLLTMHVDAGTTYHFQAGGMFGGRGTLQFSLDVTPAPVANMSFNPGDPSVYDTVQFFSNSFDPGEVGIESLAWTFGDGDTGEGCCPTHRYPADGEYTVGLTVTTFDGRTARTERIVEVRTHDVTIAKLTVPQSASVGQTRQLSVGVSNKRYGESVQVQLFKSGPGGFQLVGTLTQSVPVRGGGRTTEFKYSYTFTSDDAALGKVTFEAVASIVGARDALPTDNEVTALPTKVG
jgi:PKD repeat protein